MKQLKLREIADRIYRHLKRFEADKKINVRRKYDRDKHEWIATTDGHGTSEYYMVNAHPRGRYVGVTYVSYQGASNLTRDEALAYLAWLDDGNVGQHFHMGRSKT